MTKKINWPADDSANLTHLTAQLMACAKKPGFAYYEQGYLFALRQLKQREDLGLCVKLNLQELQRAYPVLSAAGQQVPPAPLRNCQHCQPEKPSLSNAERQRQFRQRRQSQRQSDLAEIALLKTEVARLQAQLAALIDC
uniref:BZIP domain-containing protein n=1 Tax=viral metagenome TaxID=1070528 RepID=A0A6M3J580_9ZZZZ